MTYAGALIDWSSKLATCTAASTTEAEIYAAGMGITQAQRLRDDLIATDIVQSDELLQFMEDNESCMANCDGITSEQRLRHITVKFREILKRTHKGSPDRTCEFVRCDTSVMLADMFTKMLPKDQFITMRDHVMGLHWLPEEKRA